MREILCNASRAKQLRLWQHAPSLQKLMSRRSTCTFCFLLLALEIGYFFLTKWFIRKNVTNKHHQNGGLSAILIWLPPSSPPPATLVITTSTSPFPTLHRCFFFGLKGVSIPVLNDSGRRWRRWWGGQVLRTEGMPLLKGLNDPKETTNTWNTNVDVEFPKGGRKFRRFWGKILVCF